jgi:hypothetical protein
MKERLPLATCRLTNAKKFQLPFFILWIIHIVVVENCSYGELLE